MAVRFVVHGRPATAGSKRGIAVRMKSGKTFVAMKDDSGDPGTSWRGAVASAADQAMRDAGFDTDQLLTGPLELYVEFFRVRAKSHYRTGKKSHLLRDSAPAWPDTKPDIDKLSRAILDALKGVVYRDDAQIVIKHAEKRFGTPERAVVHIREFPGQVSAVMVMRDSDTGVSATANAKEAA